MREGMLPAADLQTNKKMIYYLCFYGFHISTSLCGTGEIRTLLVLSFERARLMLKRKF